jgi:Domain of unknown function (DUF4160)
VGVVHREGGFRFVIFVDDHEPAHVHVLGGGEMRVRLIGPDGLPQMMGNKGYKAADRRKVMDIVLQHQAKFMTKWIDIHGQSKKG